MRINTSLSIQHQSEYRAKIDFPAKTEVMGIPMGLRLQGAELLDLFIID